jgi:hypothetical protein
MTVPPEPADEFIEIPAGAVHWRFEKAFLQSNWTCIWGRGCLGILDEPAPSCNRAVVRSEPSSMALRTR